MINEKGDVVQLKSLKQINLKMNEVELNNTFKINQIIENKYCIVSL